MRYWGGHFPWAAGYKAFALAAVLRKKSSTSNSSSNNLASINMHFTTILTTTLALASEPVCVLG